MRTLAKIFALCMFFTSYIVVLLTFFTAFLSPTHSTLVTINEYNEMGMEVVVLLVSIPCVAVFTYDLLRA